MDNSYYLLTKVTFQSLAQMTLEQQPTNHYCWLYTYISVHTSLHDWIASFHITTFLHSLYQSILISGPNDTYASMTEEHAFEEFQSDALKYHVLQRNIPWTILYTSFLPFVMQIVYGVFCNLKRLLKEVATLVKINLSSAQLRRRSYASKYMSAADQLLWQLLAAQTRCPTGSKHSPWHCTAFTHDLEARCGWCMIRLKSKCKKLRSGLLVQLYLLPLQSHLSFYW